VQPIRNRIDMLSTGIKSPVGIKISGPDLATLEKLGVEVERIMKTVPGASSVIAERVTGGRYIDVRIDRLQASRYGLSVADVQTMVAVAIGGDNIAEKIDGLARFPVNLRFPRELRDSVEKLKALPMVTEAGATVTLGTLAAIEITDGPPMIKSENARPNVWVYVDIHDRDLGSFVQDAKARVNEELQLPAGYSLNWSGQFEYFERAAKRLSWVVPMTLGIIFILLFMTFKRMTPALIILGTLPFALVGAVWFLFLLGHHFSIASGVGMIALAGLAAEFGIVMLIYLDEAIARYRSAGKLNTAEDWRAALIEGAVLRVRPKAMTVAVILAGLIPIMIGTGTGSEAMSRIAAPMVGGMLTAPLLSLFVLPALYYLLRTRQKNPVTQ
jgi:Cu(I)/Ag(I) efflux system membrane protein CusA/SilA